MNSDALDIQPFFHAPSCTITYLVSDKTSKKCAVIDSASNFNINTGKLDFDPVFEIVAAIEEQGLELEWILETHVHADHVTGAVKLKERLGGKVAIGSRITDIQKTFSEVFADGPNFPCDGSQFDHLFEDGESFTIGNLSARAISTPGHTPACMSYLIEDAVFVGDTVFMPDFGTARCDFPGGDSAILFRSVKHILELPDETRIFVGHDYAPGDRDYAWETTVGAQKRDNKHVKDGVDEGEFAEMRSTRDKELGLPDMIIPAIQFNIRAGQAPEPSANGTSYIQIPVNAFPGA